MNSSEDSKDEYLCYSELLADLYEKFKDRLPPITHTDDTDYQPRPLPNSVVAVLGRLDAPPRLVAHLTLVHDAAVELVDGIREAFTGIEIENEAVCFGAATHDIGKVTHPNELSGPGNQHEIDGASLLLELGCPEPLARFTRTHGAWSTETLPLDDLLVALDAYTTNPEDHAPMIIIGDASAGTFSRHFGMPNPDMVTERVEALLAARSDTHHHNHHAGH